MVWFKMERITVCILPECQRMMSMVLRIYFFVPTAITEIRDINDVIYVSAEIQHCHAFYVKVRIGVSDVV